jgi:septal ring factor EnvC (AmiA/AmiB activator)
MEEALTKITTITTQATDNNNHITQIRDRLREISGQIRGIGGEKQALEAEVARLTGELQVLNGRLGEEQTARDEIIQRLDAADAEIQRLNNDIAGRDLGQTEQAAELQGQIDALNVQLAEKDGIIADLQRQVDEGQGSLAANVDLLRQMHERLDALTALVNGQTAQLGPDGEIQQEITNILNELNNIRPALGPAARVVGGRRKRHVTRKRRTRRRMKGGFIAKYDNKKSRKRTHSSKSKSKSKSSSSVPSQSSSMR